MRSFKAIPLRSISPRDSSVFSALTSERQPRPAVWICYATLTEGKFMGKEAFEALIDFNTKANSQITKGGLEKANSQRS
jgi:hypothetical protein